MDSDDAVTQAIAALREYAEQHPALAEAVTSDVRALGMPVTCEFEASDDELGTCTGAVLSFTRRGVVVSWQIDEQALDGKGVAFFGGPDRGPWQASPLCDPMVSVLAAALTHLGYTVELELEVHTQLNAVVTGVAQR